MSDPSATAKLQKLLAFLYEEQAKIVDFDQKYNLQIKIDQVKRQLRELTQAGADDQELGWEHIDLDVLREYYQQCAKRHQQYERLTTLQPDVVCQNLVSGGFGYRSGEGGFALTDQGVLFCARQESIPRAKLHVHIQFEWEVEGKSLHGDAWGSILLLHKELVKNLSFLWSRSVGDPSERDEFGGEKLIYDVPQRAVVEAYTNFLIHRDYRDEDFGSVQVFNDRIEFINPGISNVSPEQLLSSEEDLKPKYTRNQRIIEAMRFAGLNQRKGSGIRWIRKALAENGT